MKNWNWTARERIFSGKRGEKRLLLVTDDEVRLADMDGSAIRTWVTAEAEAPTGE